MSDHKALVAQFYSECLTVNKRGDVAAVMERLLADDFESVGSVDKKTKPMLTGQVQAFWRLIPDLSWEVQEMLQDGDKVVVRSIASGTPQGDFMGVPTDGTRSFKIMTIDIHTVAGGKIARVYHLEDWPTAMKQLRA